MQKFGAGNETRTRDPDLGKVVLYQLSYSRLVDGILLSERRQSIPQMTKSRFRNWLFFKRSD